MYLFLYVKIYMFDRESGGRGVHAEVSQLYQDILISAQSIFAADECWAKLGLRSIIGNVSVEHVTAETVYDEHGRGNRWTQAPSKYFSSKC